MTNITEQVAQLHNKILGHKWDLTKQLPTSNELLRDLTDFRQQAYEDGYKAGFEDAKERCAQKAEKFANDNCIATKKKDGTPKERFTLHEANVHMWGCVRLVAEDIRNIQLEEKE